MNFSISRVTTTLVVSLLVAACGSTPSVTPVAPPAPSGPPASPTPAPASAIPSPSVAPAADAASWRDAGNLREPRNATNVVVLGSGEVLVVGSDFQTSWGYSCGASTNGSDSVEVGDPLTGVWEATTKLPSLRDAPVVVALSDGRALMTGGAAGEAIGWSAYSSTYLFDPANRRWTRSGLLNTARTNAASTVLLDGRVLVAGGRFMDRAATGTDRVLDSSEIWDPRSGTWSRTGPLAATRFRASAVTLADGRVLIVGGPESPERDPIPQASAEIYDPDSGRWSPAGTLATARTGSVLVALADGGALVAGGFGDILSGSEVRLSTVERFDPVSNTWSAADDLLAPVAGASGIRLADGRVLLAGGSTRDPEPIDDAAGTFVSGLTADAALFDPKTGAWTATRPMPSPRAGASAVLMADGSAVFAGGSASEGPASTPGCKEAAPQVVRYVPGS